jgi:hypothetical protein
VDGDDLLVTDLGQDLIYRYGPGETVAALGGPRHLIRMDDYAYVLGENDASLTIFEVPSWTVMRKVATSKAAGGSIRPTCRGGRPALRRQPRAGHDRGVHLDGTYETEVPLGRNVAAPSVPRHCRRRIPARVQSAFEHGRHVSVHIGRSGAGA